MSAPRPKWWKEGAAGVLPGRRMRAHTLVDDAMLLHRPWQAADETSG
ncbi:hypothetical protein [Mycobacterium sp. 1164966.3]|nr:hypothetical protein [Mycobacterium sp. 1164966.3]